MFFNESSKRAELPEEDFSVSLKRFRGIGDAIKSSLSKTDANSLRIPTRADLASAQKTGIDAHHAVMDHVLSNLKIQNDILPFTEDQSIVQHIAMGACCSMIYKNYIKTHEREIRERWDFPTLMRGLIFTAPRRAGKSAIVIAIIVSLFLAVKGIVIIVVANGKRAAGGDMGILAGAKKVLASVFGITMFDKDKEEHIIKDFAPDDRRRISSFSGEIGDGLGTFVIVGVWPRTFDLPPSPRAQLTSHGRMVRRGRPTPHRLCGKLLHREDSMAAHRRRTGPQPRELSQQIPPAA